MCLFIISTANIQLLALIILYKYKINTRYIAASIGKTTTVVVKIYLEEDDEYLVVSAYDSEAIFTEGKIENLFQDTLSEEEMDNH